MDVDVVVDVMVNAVASLPVDVVVMEMEAAVVVMVAIFLVAPQQRFITYL